MMTAKDTANVARLCKEVIALVEIVEHERATAKWFFGSKNTGALRRRSMDLTRALAEMRRR